MAPPQLSDISTTGAKRPSERAIAFAISIVLSKPEELSIKEYIGLLQKHVARGRRESAISSGYRHLDRSSFWRSEYERVRDALRASEGESVDLRREVDALRTKLENAKPSTGATKKRKKALDEDVVPVPRSPKKAKRDASPARRGRAPDVDVERDFDFSDVGEIGNILMRSLYQAHAALKSHHHTEAAVLAHHLVRAASALPQVLQQAVKASFTRPVTGPELLRTTLTAAGRAVASLIVGIDRVVHVADGAEVQGHVIYAYVNMFDNLLKTFEDASEAAVTKAANQQLVAASDKRPTTSKGKTKAQQPKAVNLKDIPSLNAISCFLCGTVELLDPESEIHKQLYEGFAYCAITRLGARLYTTVFGHPRDASIEAEIARSNRIDDIEDDDSAPVPATAADETRVKQAKMEAPYLVHLVSRLMAAAPAHFGAMTSTKASKAKPAVTATKKGATKGALNLAAKDRLQRTLVQCMFGTEGVVPQEEDDHFMRDTLKMPSCVEKPLPMPKVKEVEVQEWFKEEVWRLIGWEILGSEGEC